MPGYTIENALDVISECLKLAERIADAALDNRSQLGALADLGGLSAMFLARASQSADSAALLAQNGLNGDAMAVARTATELGIDYAYIAKDPATRMKKFGEYDHVSKFKIAKATDKLHGGTVDRTAMRILEQRHDTARLNNPESEHNWAGVSIRKRAIEVDRLMTYELPYADMCNASHSCYGTLEYALIGLDSEPKIHFGRMTPDPKAVDLAFAALLRLAADVIDACSLPATLADEIKRLHDKRSAFSLKKTDDGAGPAAPPQVDDA